MFILSFVLAHHLRAEGGAVRTRLLVTSASSKASLSLAHALAAADVSVVGLTSASHADVVARTGLHDQVVTYDQVDQLPTDRRSVLVDVAGNPSVRDLVHRHLGAALVDTVRVGQTDWDQPDEQLLGADPTATPFFAPTAIQQLVGAWGAAEFSTRLDAAQSDFTTLTRSWLHTDHHDGVRPPTVLPALLPNSNVW